MLLGQPRGEDELLALSLRKSTVGGIRLCNGKNEPSPGAATNVERLRDGSCGGYDRRRIGTSAARAFLCIRRSGEGYHDIENRLEYHVVSFLP